SIFVWLQYFPHWKETKNQEIILSVFSTSPAITSWPSNLLSEIIGTAVFVFSILAMSHNKVTDGLLPIIIGALI
ncbi:aquaporin, partial [Bacillus pseudomycoides]